MAHLLRNLSYLVLHHLLVSGHGLKFEIQLGDRLTKGFIGLCLGGYEALHEALQIRLGLLGRLLLWRWGVGCLVLETGGLCLGSIGWYGIIVAVGEIWVISLIGVICV